MFGGSVGTTRRQSAFRIFTSFPAVVSSEDFAGHDSDWSLTSRDLEYMGKRRAASKIDGKYSVQEIQDQQTPSPQV